MNEATFSAGWLDARYMTIPGQNKHVVQREFVEQQENGTVWSVVFGHKGKFWKVTYQDPNTSEVHVDAWFGDEQVKAVEVGPVAKFVTDWKPVSSRTVGRCTATLGSGSLSLCGLDAPWLVAFRKGDRIETAEMCDWDCRRLMADADSFESVEEVRRRWR